MSFFNELLRRPPPPPQYRNGSGCVIKEPVILLGQIMGFKGRFVYNTKFPDGAPRKLLDVSQINKIGWHQIGLEEGLRKTVHYYRNSKEVGPTKTS